MIEARGNREESLVHGHVMQAVVPKEGRHSTMSGRPVLYRTPRDKMHISRDIIRTVAEHRQKRYLGKHPCA